jgi:GAF domain-containing protein
MGQEAQLMREQNERLLAEPLDKLAELQSTLLAIGPETRRTDVLTAIAKAANDVLGGHFCVVQPYDQSNDRFLVDQFTPGGAPEAEAFKWTEPRKDGTARTALNERLLIVEDYDKDVERYPFLAKGPGVFKGAFRDVADIKACLGIRLEAGGERVGVLFVNYPEPHHFSEEELRIAELFANQAALAIRNVRLYESTVRSAEELKSLLDITRDITSIMTDVRLTLKTIIERAVKLIGTTRGAILLYHDGFGTLEAGYHVEPAARVRIGAKFPADTPLQQRIKKEREPVQIYDVATHPLLSGSEIKEFSQSGIRSVLIVPVVAKGEAIGTIGLDETRSNRSFTAREIQLCQTIAGQAAIAIENAQLYGRTSERLEVTLKQKEQLLSLVREIDEWITRRGGRVEELAEFTLNRFLELFQFQAMWLLLKEGQQLKIVATDPQHVEDKGRLLRLDASITGLAAKETRTIRIEDIEQAEPYLRELYQPVHGGGMRSELAVPMLVEDRVVGVLNLESSEPAAFTPDDQDLLESLARHLGVAIVSAEEMQERATLSEMAIEFSGSLEEEETARLILDRALRLIGGKFGQILTREGGVLEVKWATGGEGVGVRVRVDDCASGLALLPRDDPYLRSLVESGAVILSSRSVIIPNVDRVVRYKRVIEADKERMRGELAIPVMLDGKVIGVFNVESPKLGAFIDEKEKALAEFVQKHAGEIGEALRRRATAALKELMRQGLGIVNEDFGQILLLDGTELVIEYTAGDEQVGTRVEVRKLETGQWAPVTGRAAMERTIVSVPDVSKDPGYLRFLGEEMKSELVVPLIVRGEGIGVINLESPVPGHFTEEHVDLLESMASHAAAAMASARAARDRELAAVGEKSGDIVHRLSNPAGAIRWRIERLREKKADLLTSDDYLAKSLADIERNTLKIQGMVRELKEGPVESLAPFEVWALLTSALGRTEVPQSVEVIAAPEVRLPRVLTTRKLEDVFYNLMTNAVEAMPDGGRLEISAEVKDQDWVEVSIRDTGRGIPDYLLEDIFTADFTTKKEEGHGLGLWWSKAFVEKCGGMITVQSQVGEGSCFTVRLQVAP